MQQKARGGKPSGASSSDADAATGTLVAMPSTGQVLLPAAPPLLLAAEYDASNADAGGGSDSARQQPNPAASHPPTVMVAKEAVSLARLARFFDSVDADSAGAVPFQAIEDAVKGVDATAADGSGGGQLAPRGVVLLGLKAPREAIDTLAISTIAREQMGIVLAMEARESGSREKAEELLEEYSPRFKWAMAAYHPKGLPNEMPGKASNTRWAAQRLWEFIEDPSSGIDEHKVNEFVAAKPGQQSVTYLTTRSIVVLKKKKKK